MGPCNCAVVGCYNSQAKLDKWKQELCQKPEHKALAHKDCLCQPPFRLYTFPGMKRDKEKRELWIKLMKRETVKRTAWQPKDSDRVCSEHFVDGIPTCKNPNPSLKLGYELNQRSERRKLFRNAPVKNKPPSIVTAESSSSLLSPPQSPPLPQEKSKQHFINTPSANIPLHQTDHTYHATQQSKKEYCLSCSTKSSLISSYQTKLNTVTKNLRQLKSAMRAEMAKKNVTLRQPFSVKFITCDEKMNFYTGVTSIAMFEGIFKIIEPFLPTLQSWKVARKRFNSQKIRPRKSPMAKQPKEVKKLLKPLKPRETKLKPRDALLMTLMRIRLGLLNEDLADRFCISPATCSNTFKTYIRLLANTLGELVKWLPLEAVRENMPKLFRKAGYGKVRVMIDCTEVFIERSKNLNSQAASWSDYKSHNTFKFLIGISPTGSITFLSDCYSGRASDKFICADSEFYSFLDEYDHVMADKGFPIKEELMMKFCELKIPPGARLNSQMTKEEVEKTKAIANLRIHVERAINRIKTFRILKNVFPITMLHHCDDIVKTCAALCNLKPLLYKESSKTD